MGFTEEATSGCCGAEAYDDTDICGSCKDHADFQRQCTLCEDSEDDCECDKCKFCGESMEEASPAKSHCDKTCYQSDNNPNV